MAAVVDKRDQELQPVLELRSVSHALPLAAAIVDFGCIDFSIAYPMLLENRLQLPQAIVGDTEDAAREPSHLTARYEQMRPFGLLPLELDQWHGLAPGLL